MNCLACNKEISDLGEMLKCIGCSPTFHYACVNVDPAYYKSNQNELKQSWRCPSCSNVTNRRNRNDSTPVRRQYQANLNLNVTTSDGECKAPRSENLPKPAQIQSIPCQDNILLEKFSQLLDKKLEENKISILSEIKSTIQNTIQIEVKKAIQKIEKDITNNMNTLRDELTESKNQVSTIATTIEKLESENKTLKQEITQIEQQIININRQPQNTIPTDNTKKIVIYGLMEYDRETEDYLYERIINAFQDILNVDLSGYIEGLTRIGKLGYQRTVVVELLSKHITKYLLENATYFKNTGLVISKYLSEESLEQRKRLQEQVRAARKNGHHAVIRNNKLYIDGKVTVAYHDNHHTSPSTEQRVSQINNTTRNSTIFDTSVSYGNSYGNSTTINSSQRTFRLS